MYEVGSFLLRCGSESASFQEAGSRSAPQEIQIRNQSENSVLDPHRKHISKSIEVQSGPWTFTIEAHRLKRSCRWSVDQWSQIRISLMRSRFWICSKLKYRSRIRVRVKKRIRRSTTATLVFYVKRSDPVGLFWIRIPPVQNLHIRENSVP
jgi:hypothetical protein